MIIKKKRGRQDGLSPAFILGEIDLVNSLGNLDIPLYVGSETKSNIARYSRFVKKSYLLSDYETSGFIDDLCELGPHFDKKPVLYSDDDRALLNISQNRNRLKNYYRFLYPENSVVEKILNKQLFAELSKKHELPVPDSYQVASLMEFNSISSDLKYPCIIKPTQRYYWWGEEFIEKVGFYRKAIECSNFQELRDIYQKISTINPSVVIQEYVEGEDEQHYSANLFINKKMDLQGYYIAQKKRIFPIKAGSGTYVETVNRHEVLDISMDIIEKLELKGLINVQFKQDSRTGEFKLMEIHIRNSMWSLLGAKAGANLAHFYHQNLVNGSQIEEPIEAKPNVKYFNLAKDLLALKSYRAEGALTVREWWNSLKGERVFTIFSSRDLLPLAFQMWYTVTKRGTFSSLQTERSFSGIMRRYINPITKIF